VATEHEHVCAQCGAPIPPVEDEHAALCPSCDVRRERLVAAATEDPSYQPPAFVADVSQLVGQVEGRPVWSTVCLARPSWFEMRFRVPPGDTELPTFSPVRLWADGLWTAEADGTESVGTFQSGGGGGSGLSTMWMFDIVFVPGISHCDSLRLRRRGEEVDVPFRGRGGRAAVVTLVEGPPAPPDARDRCKRCRFPVGGAPGRFCGECRATVDLVVGAYGRPFSPTRSLSLMADLGTVLGGRTWMVALEGFDTWFNIRCVQRWPQPRSWRDATDCEIGGRWLASDDRGGTYVGFGNGESMEFNQQGSPGLTQELSFAPGLDPKATRLRLTLPVHDAPDRLIAELALDAASG
jgi:hypothetical protein